MQSQITPKRVWDGIDWTASPMQFPGLCGWLKLGQLNTLYVGYGTFWGYELTHQIKLITQRNHDEMGCGGHNFRWDPPTLDPTYDPSNKREASGELKGFARIFLSTSPTVLNGQAQNVPTFPAVSL